MSLDLARIRESKLIEEGFRLNSSAKSEDDLRLGEFMKWEVKPDRTNQDGEVQVAFLILSKKG